MLVREHRLTGQSNFKKLANNGSYLFLKELGLKWLPNHLNYSRFAFVVSLQVDKKAVVRNLLKRRLREIIYSNLKEIKPGFDVLILTRAASKNLKFEGLKEKIESLFKKSGLV